MPRRKLNYKLGDWIAVPIEGHGYVVGIIARMSRGGAVLFGYFFGPLRAEVPTYDELRNLTFDQAIDVRMFSDLGLLDFGWPVIGGHEHFDKNKWPLPKFGGPGPSDLLPGATNGVVWEYDDNLKSVSHAFVPLSEVDKLPEEGSSGYIALQMRLRRLLVPEDE